MSYSSQYHLICEHCCWHILSYQSQRGWTIPLYFPNILYEECQVFLHRQFHIPSQVCNYSYYQSERVSGYWPLFYTSDQARRNSYMTGKIPCSSGISLLPKGIYLCYKPLFNCWNSPQVTVLRSVRNSGFRASTSRRKLRNSQLLQSVSHEKQL